MSGLYLIGSPIWRTIGRCGFPVAVSGEEVVDGQRGIVAVVALGVKLGIEYCCSGELDRGVDAGTGVLAGMGVFVGSAIVDTRCLDRSFTAPQPNFWCLTRGKELGNFILQSDPQHLLLCARNTKGTTPAKGGQHDNAGILASSAAISLTVSAKPRKFRER